MCVCVCVCNKVNHNASPSVVMISTTYSKSVFRKSKKML